MYFKGLHLYVRNIFIIVDTEIKKFPVKYIINFFAGEYINIY